MDLTIKTGHNTVMVLTISNPALSSLVKMGMPLLLGAMLFGYRRAFGKPTWMESGTLLYFALAWLPVLLGQRFPCRLRQSLKGGLPKVGKMF